jgi:peptidoglycan LD-endopeptidase LytH
MGTKTPQIDLIWGVIGERPLRSPTGDPSGAADSDKRRRGARILLERQEVPFRQGDAEMRKTWAVIGLTLTMIFMVDPTTQLLWPPLRPVIVRLMEVVALPFRLARLSAQPPDARLLMPVAGAQVNRITDTWGAPRPGGRRHRGQDIFAPKGTAVRSATRGYVVRVGDNTLGGNVVLIAGAGGHRYYYAHLEAFAPNLRVGAPVSPETIIGFVGNTGNAARTPSHLHFGVYTVVGAINPLPLLQDRAPPSS